MNNKDKAERLREIAKMLDPEFQHHEAVFLEVIADEMEKEPKPLELSDEEIEAELNRIDPDVYIGYEKVWALSGARVYRSRIRVDLESFGVALLEWNEKERWEHDQRSAHSHTDTEAIRLFLSSPEFDKWKQQTKTGD